jgi:uncharacterized protein
MQVDHKTSSQSARHGAPRFTVKRSSIHGRGVFARTHIALGERLVEYKGRRISAEECDRIYGDDGSQPAHTFLFLVEGGIVIDGNHGGNSSRWFNHSCNPNCETEEDEDGRVFVLATRAIAPGEELTYDYNLVLDEPHSPSVHLRYKCLCGARRCRGVLFKPDRKRDRRRRVARKASRHAKK